MNKKTPTISIIIPVFNREHLISDAIDSALDQNYPFTEVIVVDDGSYDKTPLILKKYSTKINILTQSNKGQSAARNYGLESSKGDYVLFLDSDDFLVPDAISTLFYGLKIKEKEGDEWGASYGKMLTCDENLNPLKTRNKKYQEGDIIPYLFFDNFIRTGTYLVKKSFLKEIGGFKEDLFLKEDRLLLFSLGVRCKFHFVNKFVVKYRRHDGHRARRNSEKELKQGTKHLDYFFCETPSLPLGLKKLLPTLYSIENIHLFKIACNDHKWNYAINSWNSALKYRKRYALHPKILLRVIIALCRRTL